MNCLSDHNLVKSIPPKVSTLRFREKDIAKILELFLVQKERIVVVHGLRGIGKSSLARSVLHYVAERKIYPFGILHVQLKDIRNCMAMLKLILNSILKYTHGGQKA